MKRFNFRLRSTAAALALTGLSLAVSSCSTPPPGKFVTLTSLLDEMTDHAAPARMPDPAYSCVSYSSYDRTSTDHKDSKTWFANNDWNQFAGVETNAGRTEMVMMDTHGPGAIVRFWLTGRNLDGTLRVYLDGYNKPLIEGTIHDVFGPALAPDPLAYSVAHGRAWNLYLPIPFERQCKVTYEPRGALVPGNWQEPNEILYFNITCRRYSSSVEVESLTPERFAKSKDLIAFAAARLAHNGADTGGTTREINLAVRPKGEAVALEAGGPGAVSVLRLRVAAADVSAALRDVRVEMNFDGEYCVSVPFGDLFGSGNQNKSFKTWFAECDGDGGFTSCWLMPFAHSCRIEVKNPGNSDVYLSGFAKVSPFNWTDRAMHFHAKSAPHDNIQIERAGTAEAARIVNYAELRGPGVYCGDALHVCNRTGGPKGQQWWGEGDEQIYVDGEEFPSHFGTGTEDYYGYAWCDSELFSKPFHAQPTGEGNSGKTLGGQTVNMRYRALDAIPFRESLRFDMELWTWATGSLDYTPTVFWYAPAR